MHTGVVSPHASGLTNSIAHARSLSAMELQNAVAEAQNLAVQAAEAQNRVQQVAQVKLCMGSDLLGSADLWSAPEACALFATRYHLSRS